MRTICKILKSNIDVCTVSSVMSSIHSLVENGEGGYVCVSNVHMVMEAYRSERFKDIMNFADIVIPDGRPLFWFQKLQGFAEATQVRGEDIVRSLCVESAKGKLNLGIYGGASVHVLDKVIQALKVDYGNVNVVYSYSPPYRALTEAEDSKLVEEISSAEVDVLLVGVGCPKQEYWMADHRARLGCLMLGVGAAFDFISGSKPCAPKWMQYVGLEWLFRLGCEPSRLWRRYLINNPYFLWLALCQLFRRIK